MKQTPIEELLEELNSNGEIEYDVYSRLHDVITLHLTKEQDYIKNAVIEGHIEIMKMGLIAEGERKWSEGYLPKIKEQAEEYYKQKHLNDCY